MINQVPQGARGSLSFLILKIFPNLILFHSAVLTLRTRKIVPFLENATISMAMATTTSVGKLESTDYYFFFLMFSNIVLFYWNGIFSLGTLEKNYIFRNTLWMKNPLTHRSN